MDLQNLSKQMVKVLNTSNKQFEPFGNEIVEGTAIDFHNLPHQASTVYALLDSIQPVQPYTTVFGTCEDGVPFLMDLRDPSPGAILILGDKNSGPSHPFVS